MAEWFAQSPGANDDLRPPPEHVAIIMDGNGRWARQRGLPRALGHRMGVEAIRRTVKAAAELGVRYLTLYGFSTENWSRPASEVNDLMGLIKRYIRHDLAQLHQSGIRVRVIGERASVDRELLTLIDDAVQLTADNDVMTLVIAFNYGSRNEIAAAARRLAIGVAAGTLDPDSITAERFGAELDTVDLPDPDLLIRTSGEERLSNFLLWQCAYTEFVFLDEYWPEFGMDLLRKAIERYQARERRYGGLTQRSSA